MTKIITCVDDFDSLKTCIVYGSDSVSYNINKLLYTKNIDYIIENLSDVSDFVHLKEKELLLSFDLFPHNKDVQNLPQYIKILKQIKVEGIIIADPAIFMYIKKELPKINLILSEKSNIKSWLSIKFWEELFAHMCVLSEKLTCDEIIEIKNKCKNFNLSTIIHNIKHYNDFSYITILPQLIEANIEYLLINTINQPQYYIGRILQIYKKAINDYLKNKSDWKYENYIKELLEISKNKLILRNIDKSFNINNKNIIYGYVKSWGNDYINIKIDKKIKEGSKIVFYSPNNNQQFIATIDKILPTNPLITTNKEKNILIKIPLEWFKKDYITKEKIMISLPPSTIIKQI